MSKAPLDSDLYGDIYGDEEPDYTDQTADEQDQEYTADDLLEVADEEQELEVPETVEAPATTNHVDSLRSPSLPAKPQTSTSSNLSYSAQVAKQFSAYQQTPSQERQQRTEIPLPPNPRTNSTTRSTFSVPSTPIATSMAGAVTVSGDCVFGKKPSEMHEHGKLFIGGLNWDTTDEGLRQYFSQFGKVDAVTIMRDPAGTSRGFAFLTFEDPAAVSAVVSRDHQLDGKAIDPKRAIPREEHLRNTRYFVGGLAPTTTSDSMRAFFSTYGKVVDATVMLDRETGRGKGFGFVTFEDAVNSEAIVGKIGLVLDDKQIEVKAAQPRNQRDQTQTRNTSENLSNGMTYISGQNQSSSNTNANPSVGNGVVNGNAGVGNNNMNMMFQRPMGMNNMAGGMNGMMGMGGMGANQMMGMNNMGMGGMNGMGGMMGNMGMGAMNPMGAMGGMNQMGMGGMGMGAMGMGNMGMGAMGGMNQMAGTDGGMGAAGAGVINNMGNMGAMRLGMGPINPLAMGTPNILRSATQIQNMRSGGGGGMNMGGMGGMNPMGMGMVGMGMGGMGMGMGGMGVGRMAAAGGGAGVGPSRSVSRGQHSFHPYAR